MATVSALENWPTKVLGSIATWESLSANLRSGREQQQNRYMAFVFADFFEQMCREMELPAAAQHFEFIRNDLRDNRSDLTDLRLAELIEHAVRSFKRDLQD